MLSHYTQVMTPAEIQLLGAVVGAILAAFFGLNAFYFKRVVTRLDKVAELLPAHSERMHGLAKDLSTVKDEIRHIREDFRDVSELKSRVAVLEFALKQETAKQTQSPGGLRQ